MSNKKRRKYIGVCLWIYFLLLIFEGALRKWILPQLATPLLVARDPVCIAALWMGFPLLLKRPWSWGFPLVGLIAIPLAVGLGHGSFPVALFGARILILHFPTLFLFSVVFDANDIWKFAKAMLFIAIPMTVLLGFQFYLPPTHFVNLGIGGEGTSVFSGAVGRHRSSGTFSFTNGVGSFYALSGALFVGWLLRGPRPLSWWLWLSGGCFIIALPLAISRAIAFQYVLTCGFAIIATGFSPRLLQKMIPATASLIIVGIGVAQLPVFETAMSAFAKRWELATQAESDGRGVAGVVGNRVIDYGILSAFRSIDQVPVAGLGIGIGTNAGAKLLTGKRAFLVAEGGLGTMIGELGPILGITLILYRSLFAIWLGLMAVKAARFGKPLPLILGSVVIHGMFMGNTSQPTSLGFLVVGGGLILASLNKPRIFVDKQKQIDSYGGDAG